MDTDIKRLIPIAMGIPRITAPAARIHWLVEITSKHSRLFKPSIIRVESSRFSSSKLINELI